jgi:hypothetical protein
MVDNLLKTEVDQNYDFFQRNISKFLKEHRGEYALLKSAAVIDFFDGPGVAYRAGLHLFPDQIFSIQKITDEVEDMGMMSLAVL